MTRNRQRLSRPWGRILLVLSFLALPVGAQDSSPDAAFDSIRGAEALAHVRHLASDELEGRGLGSPGELAAAKYLEKQLRACGLQPAGDDGTFFQGFTALPAIELGGENGLHVRTAGGSLEFEAGKDFEPFGFSPDGSVEAPLVFGGYGMVTEKPERDDFARLEVRGKVVVVLRGPPRHAGWSVVKAAHARDRGAAALIVVDEPPSPRDPLDGLFCDAAVDVGIPVVLLGADAGERLFRRAGHDLAALRSRIDEKPDPPTFPLGATCRLSTSVVRRGTPARNVLGLLPGRDPELSEETVVLAAHYDHLGRGGYGSLAPERTGEIHNGADDNASGVAALLEVAQALKVGAVRPPRTVLFALFTGEEYGNLGSRHYVEHPAVPLARTVAMINLDTVGRGAPASFAVWGVGTASGLPEVVRRAVSEAERRAGTELSVYHGKEEPGAGDNAEFFRRGIPALLFHTGRTPEYHTPDDDWPLVDERKLEIVARTALLTLLDLASGPRLTFRRKELPPRRPPMLGIAAERTRGDGTGIRVVYVMTGSPAERAGLRPGDTILSLDRRPTPGMGALIALLRRRRAGQKAVLEILRDEKIARLTATLAVGD